MSLFKNDITEFKKFVKINKTIEFSEHLAPYEPDAVRKYILRYLDKVTYRHLESYINSSPVTPDVKLAALLPYVQSALARFTLLVASPFLDVNIGSTGYTTSSTENMVAASAARVDKLDKGLEKLGWDAIESMLAFLEENKSDYPEWVSSTAYTMHITGIVNTASEFDNEFNIDNSRLTFLAYRPNITRIETLYIKPAISDQLFAEIVSQIKSGILTDPIKKLLPLLRTAIVMFVVSKERGDNFNAAATAFLSEAKNLLDLNSTDYPLYASSSIYRGGSTAQTTFYENTEDSKIFVAGVPYINSNK